MGSSIVFFNKGEMSYPQILLSISLWSIWKNQTEYLGSIINYWATSHVKYLRRVDTFRAGFLEKMRLERYLEIKH